MNLIKTKIGLTNGNTFMIYHNLPDKPDIRIEDLINTWLESSTSHNPKNLAKLINAIGYTAYTEKQYKRQGISSRKIK